MEEKKEKRLWPGDVGYKGGVMRTSVYAEGKAKTVWTKRDPSGNPTSIVIADKILGIF